MARAVDNTRVIDTSMQTTKTDTYSSLMLTGIVMVGLIVAMLGTLFIMNLERAPAADPILIEPEPEGTENPPGLERDTEPPAPEEVEIIEEPTLNETLIAVSDSIQAALDVSQPGTGKGDSRRRGKEGEGADIIPRYERWDLKFVARDQKSYAKQLEHFGIEVGAIGGGRALVDYVKDVAGSPSSYQGEGDKEQRIYFMHRTPGVLLQYDRAILKSAGVPVDGRQILKFIPKDLENKLANIEYEYAKDKLGGNMDNVQVAMRIAKTTFECQSDGKTAYTFVVIDQRYRTPRDAKGPALAAK